MKQIKLLAAAIAVTSLSLLSCNSDKEKTTTATTDSTKDTTVQKAPEQTPPPAPAKPGNLLTIRQKVASFTKWLPVYEGHDSARLANGIHSFVIGRDLNDSNMVTVTMRIDDTAKAKQFGASADLKAAMKKGGVIGAPTVQMVNVVWIDTTTQTGSMRMKVSHKVKDFDAWKKVYDSDKPARMNAGLSDRALSRDINDPNMVVLVFAVSDLAKAKAFGASKELKDKMKEGGVEGAPNVIFYNIVKKY
jgi:hypothetical protein